MAIFDGKRIFVEAGGYVYAGQITSSVNLSANMIDVTTKDSSGWNENIAGLKSWSIDFEGLSDLADSDSFDRPFDQLVAGTAVTAWIGEADNTAGVRYEGSALVSDISLTAPNDEALGYSGTLTGTGALALVATS
jgi:TP901-1 family phage major tail protein